MCNIIVTGTVLIDELGVTLDSSYVVCEARKWFGLILRSNRTKLRSERRRTGWRNC